MTDPTDPTSVDIDTTAESPAGVPPTTADVPLPAGAAGHGVRRRVYALDNADARAVAHHELLADLLDPETTDAVDGLTMLYLRGARCLEVGAGGGSIARWLADEVGSSGQVLALDIDPRHVGEHPQMVVMRHDLTADALPAGPFDFIHARLVLNHLPEREQILNDLVRVLQPEGGVLMVEDWEATCTDVALAHPDPQVVPLINQVQAVLGRVFEHCGTDRGWARKVPAVMRRAGLRWCDTRISAPVWQGGSPGARLIAGSLHQLRTRLLDAGLSAEQLDQADTALHDPALLLTGHPFWSTSGCS